MEYLIKTYLTKNTKYTRDKIIIRLSKALKILSFKVKKIKSFSSLIAISLLINLSRPYNQNRQFFLLYAYYTIYDLRSTIFLAEII